MPGRGSGRPRSRGRHCCPPARARVEGVSPLRAPNPRGFLYVTFDLITVLVVAGSLAIGGLVYGWSASSPPATAPSKGERLLLALTSVVAAITIGSYLGDGFRGIERTANTEQGRVVETDPAR